MLQNRLFQGLCLPILFTISDNTSSNFPIASMLSFANFSFSSNKAFILQIRLIFCLMLLRYSCISGAVKKRSILLIILTNSKLSKRTSPAFPPIKFQPVISSMYPFPSSSFPLLLSFSFFHKTFFKSSSSSIDAAIYYRLLQLSWVSYS